MRVVTLIDSTNRDKILKSLEYCNWPIKKQDFDAIENEIKLAKNFFFIQKDWIED
jgi:hypothetical protein